MGKIKKRTKKDNLEREATDVSTMVSSQCQHCIHLWRVGKLDGTKWFCEAYPYTTPGIPERILQIGLGSTSPHAKKIPSQNGDFIYEPKTYVSSSGIKYQVQADWNIKVKE